MGAANILPGMIDRRSPILALALAGAAMATSVAGPAGAAQAPVAGAPGASPQATPAPRAVRVAVYRDPPFAMHEASGRWDGYAAALLQVAAVPAGLTLEFRDCATLEELFSQVASGAADLGVGNTLVTGARIRQVAFTQPVLEGGLKVMVPSAHSNSVARIWDGLEADGHLRVVAWGAAITLAISLVVVAALRRFDRDFTPHLHEGFAESFYHVVAVTMTGKTSYKGNLAPGWIGKIVAALWLVFGVATVAYLTSSLSSVMTANTITARINGPADLKGRTIGTLKGSAGERYCAEHGLDVVTYDTVDAAAAAMVAHATDAIVADALTLEFYDTSHPEVPVSTVGAIFDRRHYAFAVRPGDADLLQRLNVAILALREDGALDRIRVRWFGH